MKIRHYSARKRADFPRVSITKRNDKLAKEAKQMTAGDKALTGAASHKANNWSHLNWEQVNSDVRRLQARIVKATEQRRWGKVSALQRLLTRSFSAKALAVKRVTENKGKNTPGVDGETWTSRRRKLRAIQSLKQRGYKAMPLRRVYIPKRNGKPRPLGIPTMRDRAMQALYLLALDPCAETTSDPNSYGFRIGRSSADALQKCNLLLAQKGSATWILEGDIRACFDRIGHQWLMEHIPIEKKILRAWLQAGFIEKNVFQFTRAGTPQGGIISPVLANLALDGMERRLRAVFPIKRRRQKNKVYLIRYADDFIVTGDSPELLRTIVKPLVEGFLKERGLELSHEKTKITSINDGFDFLGQNVRKYGGKFLRKPSKTSLKNFLAKVRMVIRTNRAVTSGQLIVQLNRIIKGWANYHRNATSKRIFAAADHAIFWALMHWALRRHSKHHIRWVIKRYFRREGRRSFVFFGTASGQTVRLVKASDTKIVRHIKVRSDANPYDPKWIDYFESRRGSGCLAPSYLTLLRRQQAVL